MRDIRNLDYTELEDFILSIGESRYRAAQIYLWLYRDGVSSFDEMTNISEELRRKLSGIFCMGVPSLDARGMSSDGSVKMMFRLVDGNHIESVLIPDKNRVTLCISTQAGCPLECRFCFTGAAGFSRNLRLSEMIGQVLSASRELTGGERITNLVLMGMGEPLLNYEEVKRFLKIACDQRGLGIAQRRITVSTAGIVPVIRRIIAEGPRVNLSVSLSATSDRVRNRIMPINKRYNIAELLDACKEYAIVCGRNRLTFQYVLIKGINDLPEDARRLGSLLKGIRCKINLLPLNGSSVTEFECPESSRVDEFHNILTEKGYNVFIRASRGRDISAACGQLRGKVLRQLGRDTPPQKKNLIYPHFPLPM